MNLITGDLWSEIGSARLILFAANSTLDSRGHLIMGAGSALEAKQRFPWLPEMIGGHLALSDLAGGEFGIWFPPEAGQRWPEETAIGAFQSKRDWRAPADLTLIHRSAEKLAAMLAGRRWATRVAMPFPGIGRGQLAREDVLPLLEALPDTVWIYERSAS